MPSRDVMKNVLADILGTYTSRYSDSEGYWLLGLAESDLPHLSVALLTTGVIMWQWARLNSALRRIGGK